MLIVVYVIYRLNKPARYLQRIFWGPVDGCVDKTASTVVDEKTKEKKENSFHDGNFPNGDDSSLIRYAMLMAFCLQLLTGLGSGSHELVIYFILSRS